MDPYTGDYTESSLRDIILKNISLVSHNNIKASTLLNKENFLNFLATQKDITSQQVIDNDKFEDVASKLYLKILKNKEQIQTLTKTRDELLPKLMSGEIRVKKQFFENFEYLK
jgi:hypothetical protein